MTVASQSTTSIGSVEQYTIFCLNRSVEGLDSLREDCLECAHAFRAGRSETARRLLKLLVDHLHSFDCFRMDFSRLFQLPESLSGENDSFGDLSTAWRTALDGLLKAMETGSTSSIADALSTSMAPVMERYRRFLPVITRYVESEYANTGVTH